MFQVANRTGFETGRGTDGRVYYRQWGTQQWFRTQGEALQAVVRALRIG